MTYNFILLKGTIKTKNMKKLNLLFTFLFLVVCTCLQAQTEFHKVFQTAGYEKFSGLEKTTNGYIVAGVTNSFGAGQKDFLVIRTDFNGDTLWTRTYGGLYDEEANSIIKTTDGNFIVVGYTSSYSNYANDIANFFILKISPTGDLLWSRSYGGSGIDIAQNVIETKDHNYLIIGSTTSIGAGLNDVCLLELSSSGNYLWSKSLGAVGNEIATDAIELGDTSLIIIGKTSSFSLGGYVPFVLNTDSIGNFLWVKTYDMPGTYSPKNITANDIIRGYTNDFLFVGSKGLGSVGDAQHYIIDIDSLGNLNWAKYYLFNSGNSDASSIDKTTTGGFIVGGWMGNYYPALLCVDATGQRLWSWVYSSPMSSYYEGKGFKTLTASDGGYITTGMRYQTADTIAFLFKTDIGGNYSCVYNTPFSTSTFVPTINIASQTFTSSIVNYTMINTCEVHQNTFNYQTFCPLTGITDISNFNSINIFPNPFRDKLIIQSNNNEELEIDLYNITSRKVIIRKFSNDITLNTNQLAEGMYIYEIKKGNEIIKRGKVIKN